LPYGGSGTPDRPDVGLITYKSTRLWIEKNCFVPEWLKILHFGDVTGTNVLEHVKALFEVGRPLASGEDVARQAEALFGEYIAKRDYKLRKKRGRIAIVPNDAGDNIIKVDVWRHQHPKAEQIGRQICEAALVQADGRSRAGLREDDEPLDSFLWTDVPVPELGLVLPQLWSEVEVGLDGLMLADSGIWLESAAHAGQAFPHLFKTRGLEKARQSDRQRGHTPPLIICSIRGGVSLRYRRAGRGQRPTRAAALIDLTSARKWLEERLGPLAMFEVVDQGRSSEAGRG
jgi:hypothetical protein